MANDDTLQIAVDVETLDIGALIDLEEATKAGQIVTWCVKHTDATEAELRALPVRKLKALAGSLQTALKAELDAPN